MKTTTANYRDKDELWENMYECNSCNYNYILETNNFCAHCGKKITKFIVSKEDDCFKKEYYTSKITYK